MTYNTWEAIMWCRRQVIISESACMRMACPAVCSVIMRLTARSCTVILVMIVLGMADLAYAVVGRITIRKTVRACICGKHNRHTSYSIPYICKVCLRPHRVVALSTLYVHKVTCGRIGVEVAEMILHFSV